jgi:hypothetical protein
VLLRSLVNLYKAMGGGWVVEADRLSRPSAPESKTTGTQPAPKPGGKKSL